MPTAYAWTVRRLWLLSLPFALATDAEVESCILNFFQCIDILSDNEASNLLCLVKHPPCHSINAAEVEREAIASKLLQSWLQSLSAEELGAGSMGRRDALEHLMDLKAAVPMKPELALGLGQALHSFFWWGDRRDEVELLWYLGFDQVQRIRSEASPDQRRSLDKPSLEVMEAALSLHENALTAAGCDSKQTETFLARPSKNNCMDVMYFVLHVCCRKCPWRWRFTFLIGSELAFELAQGKQDFAAAAATFKRMEQHFVQLKTLPYFAETVLESPMRLNQNWDFFPTAQHQPFLPRDRWPPFGEFVERHFPIFKAALEALLEEDPDAVFGAAARFQNGLTPRNQDWSRIKLIHSGGHSELCTLPFFQESCNVLSQRPEIGPRCGTYLSGASIARLLPGAQLKPHVGTYPRLTLQLGLRTPSGGTLTVAGEEVTWNEGKVIIFDDTYMHKVQHRGDAARYVLVAWFCHPCDMGWREDQGVEWQEENPLPSWCGLGGPGYSKPPVPGYSDPY
eukprot:symbB.v1.2.030109.t1/scaffold3358.1/size58492/4